MKINRREFILAASAGLTTLGLSGAAGVADREDGVLRRFHGVRPTDPGGRLGLRNPERGWRIETVIAEANLKTFGPAHHLAGKMPPRYQEDWWVLDAARYEPFGLTLVQAYCYLTEFADRPITPEKLALLQASLEQLRARGFKAVLRFAYERDMGLKEGPTREWMLRHIDQLEPVLRRNVDVIYVLQAGFIGAWGEWHSAARIAQDDYATRAALIKRLLEALPRERMLQVRVPKYKRLALGQPALDAFVEVSAKNAHSAAPAARIGFHNDGFLAGPSDGGTWPEGPKFGQPGNPEYDYMTRESAFLPVDGELFWSDQGFDGQAARGRGVDGLNAAAALRRHHYSSFSLAHSYSEREGKPYSIDYWLTSPLAAGDLRQRKLPVADGWFEDGFGQPVTRTQFEYIQDYLGYRLELQSARWPEVVKTDDEFSIQIELINRGFSTLHNPRPVYLTLSSREGNVTDILAPEADPRKWQPFEPGDAEYKSLVHRIQWSGRLPATVQPGWHEVGLWLPDASPALRLDPRYAVRCANRDVPWWTDSRGNYGLNLLGSVEIRG